MALAWYLGGLLALNAIHGFDIRRGYRFRRRFTGIAQRILGVKVDVKGALHDGYALYVSNHRSLLDPFIQLNRVDAFIVSKAEVGNYPLFGAGARATGVIFVERGEASSRSGAREAIRQCLRGHNSVLIYPEGTTSNLLTTRAFKPGSFEVAAREKVPVVPVAIEYKEADDRWQDMGMFRFFLRKFGKWHTHAALHIGDAVTGNDGQQLMQSAHAWIDNELLVIQDAFSRR